jgi:hypothetical protein
MKGRKHGSATEPDISAGFRSSSTNQRRDSWAQTEKEGESGDSRSLAESDNATVERLREAVDRSSTAGHWQEIAIIAGAILLVACIVMTLVLASGINARANQILENEAVRARAGALTVSRLEDKLDAHVSETESNARKLDALLATTTTVPSRRPTTTVRRATSTTRPVPTTVRPAPPTTATTRPVPTTTTVPPCQFALLNLCVIR